MPIIRVFVAGICAYGVPLMPSSVWKPFATAERDVVVGKGDVLRVVEMNAVVVLLEALATLCIDGVSGGAAGDVVVADHSSVGAVYEVVLDDSVVAKIEIVT